MKRKAGNLLLVVVLLVAVVVGLKVFVHLKVKGQVDGFIAQAAPFVDIRYESLSTSLIGVVTMEGISVIPSDSVGVVRIGSLELDGRNTTFLLDLVSGMDLNQPPEALAFAAREVEFPLDGGYFFMNGEQVRQLPKACTLGGILQHVGIANLNYTKLLADISMGYRLNADSGELVMNLGLKLHGIETLKFDVALAKVASPAGIMAGAMPSLTRATVHYQLDQDYTRGMINYCAQQEGKTPAGFINQLFSASDRKLAEGMTFIPGQGLRSAFRSMINSAAPVEINLRPGPGFDLRTLGGYSLKQQLALLGVEVRVAGQQVADLGFTPQAQQRPGLFSLFEDEEEESSSSTQAKKDARPRYRRRYIDTPVGDLKRYLGYDVRIYLRNRKKPKQGVLNDIENRELAVEQRLHGGKMTMLIPVRQVNRAEVLRRERIN